LTEEISSYTIAQHQTHFRLRGEEVMSNGDIVNEEKGFVEFRRKVRSAEVLSAATERLLLSPQFTGRVCVVVQNGRGLKSGYAEGYFRQRYDTQSGGCGSLADEAPKCRRFGNRHRGETFSRRTRGDCRKRVRAVS
jgi:hypothetical protein